MSLNRYAKRRDKNEPDLVRLAVSLGIQLEQSGPLDWWAFHRELAWIPIEVKDPKKRGQKGEFKPSQKAFFARCDASGAPYAIWRTDADVIRFANARITA